MNRIAVSLPTLALLLAFTFGGCSAKPSADPAQPSAMTAKPRPAPELWLDKEAAEMFKHVLRDNAPCDEVYVIRWKNCEELHGWVKLDGQGGSKPASYDLTLLPKDISAITPQFKRRDLGLSGWVVVTMRKLPNTPGEAYDVRVEQRYTLQCIPVDAHDVSQTSRVEPGTSQDYSVTELGGGSAIFRGTLLRVPPDADQKKLSTDTIVVSSNTFGHVVLQKVHEGRAVSWLELRVGPTAPENEAKAGQSPPPNPPAKPVSSGGSSPPAR